LITFLPFSFTCLLFFLSDYTSVTYENFIRHWAKPAAITPRYFPVNVDEAAQKQRLKRLLFLLLLPVRLHIHTLTNTTFLPVEM
jgi:hypothetical protein